MLYCVADPEMTVPLPLPLPLGERELLPEDKDWLPMLPGGEAGESELPDDKDVAEDGTEDRPTW